MTNTYTFKEFHTIPEMLEHIFIVQQLQPTLTLEEYKQLLPEMLPLGYGQVAAFEGEKCIGISGFWINTKLYSGKYLEMDNVLFCRNIVPVVSANYFRIGAKRKQKKIIVKY